MARDVEMDKLWQTNGKIRFCRVRCSTDACKTFVHRVGKRLRRPDERGHTIEAWLKYNNVLTNGSRPPTMTVDLYTSQIVPDEESHAAEAAPASNKRHCLDSTAAGAPATSPPQAEPYEQEPHANKRQRRDIQSSFSSGNAMTSQQRTENQNSAMTARRMEALVETPTPTAASQLDGSPTDMSRGSCARCGQLGHASHECPSFPLARGQVEWAPNHLSLIHI